MPRLTFESASPLIGGLSSFAQSLMAARQINNQQKLDAQSNEIRALRDERAAERQLMLDQRAMEQQNFTNQLALDRRNLAAQAEQRISTNADRDYALQQERLNTTQQNIAEDNERANMLAGIQSTNSELKKNQVRAGVLQGQAEQLDEQRLQMVEAAESLKQKLEGEEYRRIKNSSNVLDPNESQINQWRAAATAAAEQNPELKRMRSELGSVEDRYENISAEIDSIADALSPPAVPGAPVQDTNAAAPQPADPVTSAAIVPAVGAALPVLDSADLGTPEGLSEAVAAIEGALTEFGEQTGRQKETEQLLEQMEQRIKMATDTARGNPAAVQNVVQQMVDMFRQFAGTELAQ